MTSSTTPQDRAIRLLAERLWRWYESQHSSDLTWRDFEGEARGHLKALAHAGLLSSGTQEEGDGSLRSEPSAGGPAMSADILTVLRYVSAGRGHVDVEPYPDFEARRALGNVPSFPEGDAVERVTAVLRGFKSNLGPNALSLIEDGVWKSLPLSLGDIREIAWLLVAAGLIKDPPATAHEVP